MSLIMRNRAVHARRRVFAITLILSIMLCLTVLINSDDNARAFAFIGTKFSEGIPEADGGTVGYDG